MSLFLEAALAVGGSGVSFGGWKVYPYLGWRKVRPKKDYRVRVRRDSYNEWQGEVWQGRRCLFKHDTRSKTSSGIDEARQRAESFIEGIEQAGDLDYKIPCATHAKGLEARIKMLEEATGMD